MQSEIEFCEKEIEVVLQMLMRTQDTNLPPRQVKKKTKNQPKFDTRTILSHIHNVDVISIYGLSEISALEILSETGTDLSKWTNERKFVSWLNLCPNNKISGGKLISSQLMKKKPNAASQAFRMAANSLKQSRHWLGDYFKRMRQLVATARKLAIFTAKTRRC